MRRTVVLEIELDGPTPDALDLRNEVLRMRPGSLTDIVRVEVLEDGIGKPQWRMVRTGPCRDPKAPIGECGCRDITISDERRPA